VGTEKETQFPNKKLKHSGSDQPEYDTSKRGGATGIPEATTTSRWPQIRKKHIYQVGTNREANFEYVHAPSHPKCQTIQWLAAILFFFLKFSLQIFDSSVKYTNQSNSMCLTKNRPKSATRWWYMTNKPEQ
jgi:hypothetical protein